jgi:pSer/pThr/pTyr-binding forkhead associated (FHA) protein
VLNPQTGEIWESTDLLRIGRNPNTDIQLFDRMVSRFHALLWTDLSCWWIRDLQSRNGTRVNHQPIQTDRFPIEGGEELELGGSQLRVLGILLENAEQWETCTHAASMLETLDQLNWTLPGLQRKLRLWAYACLAPSSGTVVESPLPLAPESESTAEMQRRYQEILVHPERTQIFLESAPTHLLEQRFHRLLSTIHRWHGAGFRSYADLLPADRSQRSAASLLRCALGNPWQPIEIDPQWLHWNDQTVLHLAEWIDREGCLETLPILADALEDAGCTDEAILQHLHQPLHCPACGVLDALLGRHPAISVPPRK